MKQREAIVSAIFSVLLMGASSAHGNCKDKSVYDTQESNRLAEVSDLLKRLHELGALEIGGQEDVQVKKSVLDELRSQGRVEELEVVHGIVCD